ncbi:phage tail tape measure protein [Ruminiclostridium herbifermentans]|uniref:Phage tail tape measure protein n=1 Tax=Ruminiclostridium herbifermentans TaxID=2488810 RepID=A0A4U7JDN1_9FIRM|nr:phage tail tape measure protein [Ruminiclostridium herbifermentans]QNU66915.1 phage tail tape measure protein [Ruminiclostridium herbifermentans]
MAGTIKGITIEIGGNTSPLNKALEGVNKNSRNLQSELKQVEKLLKLDPTNTELLEQKQKLLAESVDNTSNKLKTLKQAEAQVQEQVKEGKVSEEQYRAFQREIVQTEISLKKLVQEQEDFNNTLNNTSNELEGVSGKMKDTSKEVNNTSNNFDDAKDKALSFGDVLKANVIGNFIVNGLKNIGSAIKDIAIQANSASGLIQAKLGLTKQEAKDLTSVAKSIWKDGFGENVIDVTNDLAIVKQYLGDISNEELKGVTEKAYTISNVFGTEVNESVKSVKTMMDNFGVSSTEAFDIITVGFQNGLDFSGEFLDTLNEYAPQFASMGLSADEAMKMLKNGVDNGAFSLDKVADAMKEFNIRIMDGSNTTREGLNSIGINYDDLLKKINNGTMTTGQVMQLVIDKLKEQDDATTQNLSGVALFGTQWEDLGKKAVLSLNDVNNGINSISGATDKASQAVKDDLGTKLTTATRGIQEAFAPLAEDLLDMVNNIMPNLKSALQWIVDNSGIVKAGILGIGAGFIVWNVSSTIFGVVEAIKAFRLANEGATIAQAALNLVMNANPIGIIITVIAGLITAIIALWNTNEDFRNALIGIWEGITSTVSGAINKIKGFFNVIIDFVKSNWQGLLLLLVNPFTGAFKLLYDNCESFRNFVDDFVEKVKTAFKTTIDKIVSFFSQLPGRVATQLINLVTKFTEWKANITTWIITNLPMIISSFVGFFAELPSKVWNVINGVIDKFASLKEELIRWANEHLPSFIAKFIEFMMELPNKMINIGMNIVEGIWKGISSAVGWLKDKISGFVGGIVDEIKDSLGIHSPSRVLADEVGKYMAQGIGVGFEDEMNQVSTNMAKAIPVKRQEYASTTSNDTTGVGLKPYGYNQTVNIYSPTPLTPAEVARQTRNASRKMVLGV